MSAGMVLTLTRLHPISIARIWVTFPPPPTSRPAWMEWAYGSARGVVTSNKLSMSDVDDEHDVANDGVDEPKAVLVAIWRQSGPPM